MGCLISYFEIGGHIVQCVVDNITSHSSSKPIVSAAERPERGRNSARSQASSMPQRSSFAEHWFKTQFHVLREFTELPTRRQISMLTNPRIMVPFGIQKNFEVMEMHYEYVTNS